MTQLTAIHAKLTGDASGLKAAAQSGEVALGKLGAKAASTSKATAHMGGGLTGLTGIMQRNRFATQQLGHQFQDIAIQLQMGTRASTVFAQQGSQILSVMGPMGAMMGASAAVTIPLLAAAFTSAAGEASAMGKALKEMGEEAEDAELKLIQLQNGLATIAQAKAFQEIVALERELADLQKQIGRAGGRDDALLRQKVETQRQLVEAKREEFNQLIRTRGELIGQVKSMKLAREEAALVAGESAAIQNYLAGAAGNADALTAGLNNAANAARNVMAALSQQRSTVTGFEEGDPRGGSRLPGFDYGRTSPIGRASGRRGGAATGGGAAKIDPLTGQLETLQDTLKTAAELEMENFAERQEVLRNALEQRHLTQQEFAELDERLQRQHQEKMASIDAMKYGSRLHQTEAFMGAMADALQHGGERMQKVAATFGAAEALINAWRAYSQTLADPSLPFFAKFAAAAKVLAAGIGAVNAIKSVGGSGNAGSGGGAAGASAGAAPQAPQVSKNVAIQLRGETFSAGQVRELINRINEAVEGDGAIVRVV